MAKVWASWNIGFLEFSCTFILELLVLYPTFFQEKPETRPIFLVLTLLGEPGTCTLLAEGIAVKPAAFAPGAGAASAVGTAGQQASEIDLVAGFAALPLLVVHRA